MIVINSIIRRLIPSTARLTYSSFFRVLSNAISEIPSILYTEFRGLPRIICVFG